jgi:hypothetical protein
VTVGVRDRLGAAVDPEFGEDLLDVAGDCLGADDEFVRDLLLRLAFGKEVENLQLAPR